MLNVLSVLTKFRGKLLCLLFFYCLLFCCYRALSDSIDPSVVSPYVKSGSLELLTFPDGQNELLNLLNKAVKGDNLYLEIYEMDDPNIENELISLSNKGVQFNLIYDDFEGKGSPNPREKYIEDREIRLGKQYGWNTYPSSTGYDLTHSKTFLDSNKFAIIMSANLIDDDASPVLQSWSSTRDFALYTTNMNVLNTLKSVMDGDIGVSGTHQKTVLSSGDISSDDVVISPDNSSDKLSKLINSATSTVDIYAESFSDYNTGDDSTLLDQLASLAEKGIKVRALVQDSYVMGTSWNEKRVKDLYDDYTNDSNVLNNLDIRLCHIDNTLYIHAKVIDVDSSESYIGSINFSNNSLTKCRELGIICSSPNISNAIENQFNLDWNYFSSTSSSYYDYNPLHQILPKH